jgi:hypothetical protein
VLSELIVKFFHGDFTPQGFKRYSGLWKGPPPGNIGKKARGVCLPDLQKLLVSVSWRPGLCARQDIAVGVAKLKEQMANPMRLGAKGSKKTH